MKRRERLTPFKSVETRTSDIIPTGSGQDSMVGCSLLPHFRSNCIPISINSVFCYVCFFLSYITMQIQNLLISLKCQHFFIHATTKQQYSTPILQVWLLIRVLFLPFMLFWEFQFCYPVFHHLWLYSAWLCPCTDRTTEQIGLRTASWGCPWRPPLSGQVQSSKQVEVQLRKLSSNHSSLFWWQFKIIYIYLYIVKIPS